MTEAQETHLKQALQTEFRFSEEALKAAMPFFYSKQIQKGDFFNLQKTVCRCLAFVDKGFFRVYLPMDDA